MVTSTPVVTAFKFASYPLIVAMLQYTGISGEASGILAILLLADVVTAVIRVLAIDPRKFSSHVGILGVLSKCLTFSIPFIIAIVGKGAGFDMAMFVDISMSTLIVYEGWSVIGNIGQIRKQDTTLNEYDAVSFLINKVQVMFKGILENIYKQKKDIGSND